MRAREGESTDVSEGSYDLAEVSNGGASSELTVTGIDLLGREGAVVASVACKQCTSGVGDDYEVLLGPGDLKRARELRVRLNPMR
jgi:hypothetical protein